MTENRTHEREVLHSPLFVRQKALIDPSLFTETRATDKVASGTQDVSRGQWRKQHDHRLGSLAKKRLRRAQPRYRSRSIIRFSKAVVGQSYTRDSLGSYPSGFTAHPCTAPMQVFLCVYMMVGQSLRPLRSGKDQAFQYIKATDILYSNGTFHATEDSIHRVQYGSSADAAVFTMAHGSAGSPSGHQRQPLGIGYSWVPCDVALP